MSNSRCYNPLIQDLQYCSAQCLMLKNNNEERSIIHNFTVLVSSYVGKIQQSFMDYCSKCTLFSGCKAVRLGFILPKVCYSELSKLLNNIKVFIPKGCYSEAGIRAVIPKDCTSKRSLFQLPLFQTE